MPECSDCSFETDSETGLKIHHTRQHKNGSAKKEYECAHCGDTFEDYESRKEDRDDRETPSNFYCSRDCKDKGEEREKHYFDCAWCGDEVVRQPSATTEMGDYDIDNHFCDKDCESKFKQQEWVGENHPNWTDNTVERCCDGCGTDIEVMEYYVGKQDHFFCDQNCYNSWQLGRTTDYNESQKTQTHSDCPQCGNRFELTTPQRHNSHRSFCSNNCSRNWMSEFQSGDKNPQWKGGKERYYGSNWNQLREEIIERDDSKCQICECTQSEHFEQYGGDLHVHHITRLLDFDTIDEANKSENLITLCTSCHSGVEQGTVELGGD